MAARGTAYRPGGTISRLSPPLRYTLAAGLLAVGVGDLVAINLLLSPRYSTAAPLAGRPSRSVLARNDTTVGGTPRASVAPAMPGEAGPGPSVPRVEAGTPISPPPPPSVPKPAATKPAEPPAPVAVVPDAPPSPATVPSKAPQQGGAPVFADLLFARNATWLSPPSRATLRKVAEVLTLDRDRRVVLSGHCDTVGDPEFNRWLSLARARRASRYLRDQGIEPARIEIKSFGTEHPAEGESPSGIQARNRRVEIALE